MRSLPQRDSPPGQGVGRVAIEGDAIAMPATPRVRLWMIADAPLWEPLRGRRELRVDPALIGIPEYRPQYDWLRGQLRRQLPGYEGGYPWWAWALPKPDLRETTHHNSPPGRALARLTLDLPTAEVRCFDFAAWHLPLNDGYLSLTPAQDAAWEATPEAERTRAALEASWERLFAPDAPRDPGWIGQLERVQAVFKTLRLADVAAVTPFRSRLPKRG